MRRGSITCKNEGQPRDTKAAIARTASSKPQVVEYHARTLQQLQSHPSQATSPLHITNITSIAAITIILYT